MTTKPHELGAVRHLLQYLHAWAGDIDPDYLLSKRVVSKKEARKHHREILQVLRHTDIDHLLSEVVDAINRLEDPERERIAASSREAALQTQIAILRSKMEHATAVEDTVAETTTPATPAAPLYFRYKPSGSIDVSIAPCAGKGFPLYSATQALPSGHQPPTTP